MKDHDAKSLLKALKAHRDNNQIIIDQLSQKTTVDIEDLQKVLDQQWDLARILGELIHILTL
jgi:hypothetical protein